MIALISPLTSLDLDRDYGEKLSRVKGTTWSRQSLFFFRFSERSASAWERRSREPRETRAAAGEEKSVPLPSRAFSQARGHLRVSRVLLDGLRKKRGKAARSLGSQGL